MITQEKIAYSADDIKSMIKTCEKYNKVRERAEKIYNTEIKPDEAAVLAKYLPILFPELNESKDERIRKTIYGWIYTEPSEFFDNGFSKEEMLDWVEKQGEKKPTDEVEPKFKIGDWITDGSLTCKVLGVTGKSYDLHLHNDDYCHFETDIQCVDKYYRLWAIQDAKDGDVLVAKDDRPFIFTGEFDVQDDNPTAYCGINSSDKFITGNGSHWTFKDGIKPATKEQRDLLFQKITEAGYEWDSEKKELKKIEPKNPIVNVPPRELILSIWDLGNEWKELTNGSISTEYGTQLEYIQKHWQESSYYDNIGDNIPTLTDKDYDKLFINCKREKIET